MFVAEVVYNLLGLLALSVLSGFISSRYDKKKLVGKILQGIIFGFIAVAGMMFPFVLKEGLFFDGRSIVISLCTLFFGPLPGFISAILALGYRIYIGGSGIFMGSSVIASSFLIGYLFYNLRKIMRFRVSTLNIYFFGLFVHLAMMFSMFLLPLSSRRETFNLLTFTILGIYPFITLLIGKILFDQEQKQVVFTLIKNKEASLRATLYSIADAVITTDTFGSIMQMNKEAEELTGWKEEEAQGKDLDDVYQSYNEDTGDRLESPKSRMQTKIPSIWQNGHSYLKSRNTIFKPIAESISPIIDDSGEIVGMVIVFRDQSLERRKIQELEESSLLFSTTFHFSPVPMLLVAVDDGVFHDVNTMFLDETGYTRDEVIGQNSVQLNLYFDLNDRINMIDKIRSEGKAYGLPFILRIKDGSLKHCLLSSNVIKINGREFYLTTMLNISQKKRDDQIRHMQFNLANAMISSASMADFFKVMKNELGVLVDTTNFIFALYEEKNDMLTAPFMEDEKDEIAPTWSAARSLTGYVVKQGKTVLLNKAEISRLAAESIIDIIGTPAECWLGVPLISSKKVLGVIVIQSYSDQNAFNQLGIEILETVAKQFTVYIEKKQIEEESLILSKAVVQSPVTIVITDLNGSIEYVNPKFTELTGYTLKEAFGKNPRILKSGEQSSDFYKELWNTISSGKEWHGEFHNKKKDGELFWESAIIAPIIDSNNKITHYVALKEDVTEKKRLLLELISAKDRAEHADKLKTSFLQNMSHEIRTPLNGILGFAHLLNRENITTENIRQYAHVIQTSGNRLLELINNLIDISKIESGTLEVTMKEFELNNLIYSVSDQFKPLSASKGVMLKVELEPRSKEINIISDELKIHQILTNLINNAFKFTKEGSVEVGYSLVVDKISFYVKDTGSGISEENQTKIFERFFQIDSSMTRGYEGSGLGLSICKGLVEMLKGEIWVESVLNQGTIFHFTIPLIEGKPLVISEASPEVKPVFKYKSILIAEDDEYSFLYLQEIFNNFNVQITRATNGQDAVDTCKSRKDIDLVMMDIKMPIKNGIDASREIKSFRPDLHIIAQTAYAYQSEKQAALEVGCDDYLSKPISVINLLESLNK